MFAGDLIDDLAWLPGQFHGGELAGLGIREALLRSHEVLGLAVEVPTMFPAILRHTLLPVVVAALGSPATREEWAQRFRRGQFDTNERDRLNAYLDEYRGRFDLFGVLRPFAQVAGLCTAKDETKGSALLVTTAASGNNVPIFAGRTEGDPLPLTPPQSARWLVHAQCWDTAAIKTGVVGDSKAKSGKTVGNPVSPLGQLGVLMPIGRTLYETLLLNIPIGAQDRLGTPQWLQDPATSEWRVRAPDGLLDLWTWQSRRIRLFPESSGDSVVVTRVIVAAGDRLSGGAPGWEPHTAWRFDKPVKGSKVEPPLRPLRHTPGKAIWRGMHALLALEATSSATFQTSDLVNQLAELESEGAFENSYPLRVETFGMVYGTQSAVVEDLLHDAMPLPVAALRANESAYALVLEATEQAEKLAAALNNLSADLRRAIGAEPIPWDKGQRPGEQLLYALDPLVRRLLAGLAVAADDPELLDRGQLAWEQLAHRAVWQSADPLFAVPATAFLGRTVTVGKKDRHYRLGLAANDFRYQIDTILPRAAAARSSKTRGA
ncbi:type I-E CRISPR-associated protein Cse1/CasA [Nocardia sp. SYP-A9097]|uniref:type I-E CRISPR-associated protein Cse1/CasA n=1 Tax=Nocardia sp. SYP-A9097 TaxID=2663237 RepID=UPI00129A127D|nr:type I-E CRISPR-associated protein Cse1/CasA [Nocardia sp. SYP-A9097]MRH93422.1 type I-E CRISPR-associated protein Cse1/CasA [Nocardia sp. SYP-A9097]